MLKALELAGFKSFADRTRFDFPDGITVVVGPNGSGKSNIVDAMKWVLGSQSAKSLRGKDMSDVIFKGSQTRGPAGAAEATIIFDNSGGQMPVDAPEVHVTRRVYRSGEGEYLINQQAVRLKDVKALIRGTGIGIDAYSLIEQGKVDRMLQANAKDRRAIFEEAAGISRFKAKKVEAERRLERVQTNLTRLGDIVDEVATRLKTLKSQAGKAERYRQASDRLKELRTVVAWNDWLTLSTDLNEATTQLEAAQRQHREADALRESLEEQRQAAEMQLQTIAEAAREAEQSRSELSGEIARIGGRRESDQTTLVEQRRTLIGHYRRLRAMRTEAGSAIADLRKTIAALEVAEAELADVQQKKESIAAKRDAEQATVHRIETTRDDLQRDHLAAVRRVAEHEANRGRVAQQMREAARALEEIARNSVTAEDGLKTAQRDHDEVARNVSELEKRITDAQREVEIADAKVCETRRVLERRREEIGSLKIRLQGITERARVLEELQQKQEGVSGGVREVLRMSNAELKKDLVGIVADCFSVDRQVAPLIDAALGPRSQYVIVRGGSVSDAISRGDIKIGTRVGIIRLDELPNRRPGDKIRLDGLAGVIGRADKMIDCEVELEPLVRHLLGNTWLVDTLATAIGLRKLSSAGLRFVTASGDLLDNDGSSVVGPPGGETGLVSRRSELAAAKSEMQHYSYQIAEAEKEVGRLTGVVDSEAAELGRHEQAMRKWITEHAAAEAKLHHVAERLSARQATVDELKRSSASHNELLATAKQQDGELAVSIQQGKQEIETLEAQRTEVDVQLTAASEQLREVQSEAMSISVEAARSEQRVESLTIAADVARRDQSQREAANQEVRDAMNRTRERITEIETRILEADNRLAELMIAMESADAKLQVLAAEANQEREATRRVQTESQAAIKAVAKATEAVATISSARDAAALKQTTLADRIAEDYQIDLRNDEPPEELAEIEDRSSVDEEISRLRGQVQNVGSVNMEALEELNELQVRYDELHGQYQDLTAAKDSLQRVIARINADSRRLFLDTLEAIRINFQKLYRKSFGGGHADLILEESDDPLEAGVEIVATPPGKPSFSNSLLSGGEKALTAVALLMSIFQYRPSPFCVLDEVDAPFDEANIGRFVTVLTEFLDQSKFIVVTHSKKTMTAATTLYGVTMQESGVSKQVSIRFEDVSEDGQINAA
ncbi:MAG: chromosome segregation protein SMC [Rhodopirellula sp.]|jgi:chromosome segregation protein|uniref:Chromosome partition protein Smc n=1 Tax=Rhodopirellula europaea SH398 TaxID=1263868 RepID=M5SLM1_9BACT|nr:chromosome segregation protein SMC [Rhodopirellula europaea]EMI28657.1 chromosome partition protein Smc [Rhodopirellula europaea SH398]MAP09992.1 chromosome segregation protein SMC [Rhodopirellula sp.]